MLKGRMNSKRWIVTFYWSTMLLMYILNPDLFSSCVWITLCNQIRNNSKINMCFNYANKRAFKGPLFQIYRRDELQEILVIRNRWEYLYEDRVEWQTSLQIIFLIKRVTINLSLCNLRGKKKLSVSSQYLFPVENTRQCVRKNIELLKKDIP